jgi:Lrp/AsnC family transcriptional regulator for asnA, asnC and gidA
MNLDETDIKIIHLLLQDSSKPFVDIAKQLGVTDGTIHQRVKKLKKSGIIKRFTIKLDTEILGSGSLGYVFVSANPGHLETISKKVSELQDVQEVYEVHTHGELLVKIRASSQEAIRNVMVNEIRKIEGVSNTELIPVYKSWKEENNLNIKYWSKSMKT